MSLSRRRFITTGIGLAGAALVDPRALIGGGNMVLDQAFIDRHKRRIEQAVIPAMEAVYLPYGEVFDERYRPGLKYIEKVVSFYDYQATGISVLASLTSQQDPRVVNLLEKIQRNIKYYKEHIFKTDVGGNYGGRVWAVPLRRLLLHLALAYQKLEPALSDERKQWYAGLIDEEVRLAIEHNHNFYPGERNLNLPPAVTNNHTAIFMQGIYYCGQALKRPEWVELTGEFAQRMYGCVQPDGYFEENTNETHEGGPSLIYTRLTLGCLYDVLDGRNKAQEKFVKAGNFYRSFVDHDYRMISIADERTNCHEAKGIDYGLALHSLTPEGRYYIVDNLEGLDYSGLGIETLAVIHHELDLMRTGGCRLPENRKDGNSRIRLPLGVVRKDGFTAGLSALLALNRLIRPASDYALDQQDMVYLSHDKAGLILIGYKSKNDPSFSTFRVGDDAYTVRTGELKMGKGWAEADLYYRTFQSKIRWEISRTAKLILSCDSDQQITSSFPITDEKYLRTDHKYSIQYLNGFSPYTQGNKAEKIKSLAFEWKKKLVIEFECQ
jgi:hypothetical protein